MHHVGLIKADHFSYLCLIVLCLSIQRTSDNSHRFVQGTSKQPYCTQIASTTLANHLLISALVTKQLHRSDIK
jgi:hypothetical protein